MSRQSDGRVVYMRIISRGPDDQECAAQLWPLGMDHFIQDLAGESAPTTSCRGSISMLSLLWVVPPMSPFRDPFTAQ